MRPTMAPGQESSRPGGKAPDHGTETQFRAAGRLFVLPSDAVGTRHPGSAAANGAVRSVKDKRYEARHDLASLLCQQPKAWAGTCRAAMARGSCGAVFS